ncbi:MAG: hypothetical protein SFW07_00300 [Gammaproteobacteria bacterium]|nr:hypothetical protein [Gammaproteobacteria bacterium]
MFDDGIYYLSGNYKQTCDAFTSETFPISDFYKPGHSQKWLSDLIARDVNLGTPFFVEDENELKILQERWNATKIEDIETYMQGDTFGSFVAKFIYELRLQDDDANPEVFFRNKKDISFGYIDDNNKLSGVSIHYSTDKDEPYWIISVLTNASAKSEDRKLHTFTHLPGGLQPRFYDKEKLSALHPTKVSNQITSKKIFPRKILPFQQTLKDALNSERVFTLIGNMLNPDGTIKPDFFDKVNLEQRGYKTEGLMITHPPVPKKSEDTVTTSATPVNPKPNTNVTEFIKIPRIAAAINKAIADRVYVLSEDRHFLVNKNDQREILIGPKGEMKTDPINTAETPNPTATIEDIFIVMMRTYSIVFREGGEANFPSEKINLNFQQAKGASETQKENFLRLEADIRKRLVAEIERNAEQGHYPDAFLNKITFNGMKLNSNPLKRPADNVESESAEETETASKRPRSSTR